MMAIETEQQQEQKHKRGTKMFHNPFLCFIRRVLKTRRSNALPRGSRTLFARPASAGLIGQCHSTVLQKLIASFFASGMHAIST